MQEGDLEQEVAYIFGGGWGVSRSEEVVCGACLSWKIGLLALGGHGCLSLCVCLCPRNVL